MMNGQIGDENQPQFDKHLNRNLNLFFFFKFLASDVNDLNLHFSLLILDDLDVDLDSGHVVGEDVKEEEAAGDDQRQSQATLIP